MQSNSFQSSGLFSSDEAYTSVEAKRLPGLAEHHQHHWLRHADLTRVDLGKGKRMLVRGGRLHPKYLITLPSDLDDHARETYP